MGPNTPLTRTAVDLSISTLRSKGVKGHRYLWRLEPVSPKCYVPDFYDEAILSNLSGSLTPQAAEGILALGFSEDQQTKMRTLAEKSRDGSLTTEEREEANSFERISSLLGILQSRARIVLHLTAFHIDAS